MKMFQRMAAVSENFRKKNGPAAWTKNKNASELDKCMTCAIRKKKKLGAILIIESFPHLFLS